MLYQQLASQLDNGRPLVEAMEDFRDRLARRGRKGLAQAMREATSCLKDGKTFVQSMGPTLSPMERSVLASGEKAGQLTNSMRLVLDEPRTLFSQSSRPASPCQTSPNGTRELGPCPSTRTYRF